MSVESKESCNLGYTDAVLGPMAGNNLDRPLNGASPQHTTVLLWQKANKLVRTNKRTTPCTTNKVVFMVKEAMVLDDQEKGKIDNIFDLRFNDLINSNRLTFLCVSFWMLLDEC